MDGRKDYAHRANSTFGDSDDSIECFVALEQIAASHVGQCAHVAIVDAVDGDASILMVADNCENSVSIDGGRTDRRLTYQSRIRFECRPKCCCRRR